MFIISSLEYGGGGGNDSKQNAEPQDVKDTGKITVSCSSKIELQSIIFLMQHNTLYGIVFNSFDVYRTSSAAFRGP